MIVDTIAVRDLAHALGRTPQSVSRWLVDLNITPFRRRGRRGYYLISDDVSVILAWCRSRGMNVPSDVDPIGWFAITAYAPGRVECGFTESPNVGLERWACRMSWTAAATAVVTRDAADLDLLVGRADALFGLLPQP